MCVCVCVCVCVCDGVCGAVAHLVRECIWRMKTSATCRVAGSSHSDGDLCHKSIDDCTSPYVEVRSCP